MSETGAMEKYESALQNIPEKLRPAVAHILWLGETWEYDGHGGFGHDERHMVATVSFRKPLPE